MEKYVPSGYQIINITDDVIDEDGFLSDDLEITKVIKDIITTKKITKPILLLYDSQNMSATLCGFMRFYNNQLVLSYIKYNSAFDGIDTGVQVVLSLEGSRIAVGYSEI